MSHHSPQLAEAFKLKGYLDKKSSQMLVGWQSRYWAVVGMDLLYYQDESQKDIKGKFTIKKIQNLQEDNKKIFTFVYDNRKYQLRAENTEQRNLWIKGMKVLKKYFGDDLSEPSSPVKLTSSSLRDLSEILSFQQQAYVIADSQMSECKSPSQFLKLLGLVQISSKFSTKRISSRVAIILTKQGYLFVISSKSLLIQYQDGDILSQQQIKPFQLNTLYRIKIGSEKAKEVCKTSSIFSVDFEEFDKILKINCGKRIQFIIKQNGKQFQKKLKKSAEVGREYHNDKNISLNTNIGPLVKIYQTYAGVQCREKVKIYFQSKFSYFLKTHPKNYDDFTSFSIFFSDVVSFQTDYLNAFEVSNSKHPQMISDFQQFIHLKVHRILTQFWDQKYRTLIYDNLLQFGNLIDQYRKKTTKYAKDPILDYGIGTLVKIYLRSIRQKFFSLIQKLKVCLSKISFSIQLYNFLHLELSKIISNCQSRQSLIQVVEFVDDCYKIWIQQLQTLSQKQTNPENLTVTLAEMNEFNSKIFTQMKDMILNNGLDALAFDDSLNESQIIASHKNLILFVIQRLFKVLFSNIDRNFINQSLMSMNLQKLVSQINGKVQGLKNIGKDEIKEIRKQVASQLLQFQLNLIVQYKPEPKDKIDSILKKINIDRSIIQKQFLKTYQKQAMEKHMAILIDLIEFLASDSLISIRKHFKSLKNTLAHFFTLSCAKNLLELKTHLTKDDKNKLYAVCVDIISSENKSLQYQESKKESMLQSFALSSRRSTLTLSLQRHTFTKALQQEQPKQTISGYLKKKKIDNRSIKRTYERRYFTVLQGHLLWYLNESSVELHNQIDLKHLKLVALHETKKQVFFLHLQDCAYQFKAQSAQLCKEWVRVLKSYISNQNFQSEAIIIQDDAQLFKDYGINNNKPHKLMRLQSTRQSILSQLTEKSRPKDRISHSPVSPPKSPTKSMISRQDLTQRQAPLIKKQSLNIQENSARQRGCWGWFKDCMNF